MPEFLLAIQHPDNYVLPDPEVMMREIGDLNREMAAAGVRNFAGGLEAPAKAKSVRRQGKADAVISDGPYLEAKEYIGGLWLLTCADMEEALGWARKAAAACRAPVEVRQFQGIPEKWKAVPERTA